MSKKAKREQKPAPVGEAVAAEMETRAAYQNLIQSFTTDQNVLEAKIKEIEQAKVDHSDDHTPPQGSDHSSN